MATYKMNNLEFSWKKIRKTQNIDTRYNIFRREAYFLCLRIL